jgi:hypothetical protein
LINVGVDDTGYDVKFFGATAGAYMLWDESADDLILGGAAGLSVNSAALVTGVLTTTAATVFNGGFADVDFRVESDTITHALFVQGSDGFVGIGTSSPAAPLSVYNASNPYANFADAANYFNVGVITSAYGLINSSLPISFQISDTERMGIDSSGTM